MVGANATPRYAWERALRDEPLDKTTKLVGLVLATYSNKDGSRAHPGTKRLARDCHVSTRTVMRHLEVLREAGFLERYFEGSSAGRQGLADEYQLTVPVAGRSALNT